MRHTLNEAKELQHLAKADQHIAGGERRIAAQEQLVARLRDKGQQTAEAEALLLSMQQILVQWQVHRTSILDALQTISQQTNDGGDAKT